MNPSTVPDFNHEADIINRDQSLPVKDAFKILGQVFGFNDVHGLRVKPLVKKINRSYRSTGICSKANANVLHFEYNQTNITGNGCRECERI